MDIPAADTQTGLDDLAFQQSEIAPLGIGWVPLTVVPHLCGVG
ncbi:hypothetical protein RHIZ404_130002 [Rhizobium sp. EC-SD404]|nr:hypothetical protein RHIZ404_130002 [Rhizobium sp. EC-SD404]